ncbi:FabD lysophospholipase-like protein [Mycena capillaripes]|nr:FabD lysophospholipase-like protein [Mycena capillaripes]
MSSPEVGLKLLALDGGGIRGLSELLMIRELMHRLMFEENKKRKTLDLPLLNSLPKPCDYFDLIGGTSTGGIIALMLGRLRMDVDTAIMCYDRLAKNVFSDVKLGVKDGKFKATKLEEAIKSTVKQITGDSETPLLEDGETVCRTFVCAKNAQNMSGNIPVLFRTYESRESHTGCTIWEAARATSAAPTFFKRIEIGRGQAFIDGGLGRNNPSKVVLDEAKKVLHDRRLGCIVSIGTGQSDIISIEKPRFFQKLIPKDVIDALKGISTDCEATHEEMLGLFHNYPNTYFRLNVEQGMQRITLSEWEKLSHVEAHTAQYMKRNEVEEKLVSVVNAIRSGRVSPKPLAQPMRDRKLCPLPVSTFTGRKDILQKIHQSFDLNRGSRHIFVLHGLGGSGKSQLAFKFLHDSQANHWYDYLSLILQICHERFPASLKYSILMPPMNRHLKLI